jgi:N-acetylmuramic acid 6-phosphate etherase
MIMDKLGLTDYNRAKELLLQYGSVKKAVDNYS